MKTIEGAMGRLSATIDEKLLKTFGKDFNEVVASFITKITKAIDSISDERLKSLSESILAMRTPLEMLLGLFSKIASVIGLMLKPLEEVSKNIGFMVDKVSQGGFFGALEGFKEIGLKTIEDFTTGKFLEPLMDVFGGFTLNETSIGNVSANGNEASLDMNRVSSLSGLE